MFSDILITSDFDHTLTARDSSVPRRNIEAIEYFMANGGIFTVNTGRSLPMSQIVIDQIPVNAPILCYNGGLAYDIRAREILFSSELDLDMAETMRQLEALFPQLVTENEGLEAHYLFKENPLWNDFCANNRCRAQQARFEDDLGPFLKFCVYGPLKDNTVSSLYQGSAEEKAYFDRVEAQIREKFGHCAEVFRAAPRIVDVQARGVSKLKAARRLQELLGRKILVCIGDAANDLPMLEGADYSFCPADGSVAARFSKVCKCDAGAVADVIYEKLPEILGRMPGN